MINHITTVHEEKKESYGCSECESKFASTRGLYLHVVSVHEGKTTAVQVEPGLFQNTPT